jgi:hypothetical protein
VVLAVVYGAMSDLLVWVMEWVRLIC